MLVLMGGEHSLELVYAIMVLMNGLCADAVGYELFPIELGL